MNVREPMDHLDEQKQLIDRLASRMTATEGAIAQFETHISRVLVAGQFAYKFKKAVRLPFLDFSTLEARHFYCEEECRLNRRLAPRIYLDVVPVTKDAEQPVLGGDGTPVEYAVRMRAFAQEGLWIHRVARGLLTAAGIDSLAAKIARFHLDAAVAPADTEWGSAQAIASTSDETLSELEALVDDERDRGLVAGLLEWETGQRHKLAGIFDSRKKQGMVHECHGDLHSGNILTMDGEVEVFDCIEFSDRLRWIDVMNDLAFVCMDLAFRKRADLAVRLLNRYLAMTGDYAGLAVMRYYQVHRALVRSKVMLLRAAQAEIPAQEKEESTRSGLDYLAFAHHLSMPGTVAVMITHGYSGSGKTTFSRYAVELLDAIQLRSDVERKRMHGLAATSRPGSAPEAQLYSAEATQRTYERLLELARCVVGAGWTVIVDAAFLMAAQRRLFRDLAVECGVPFVIFDVQASRAAMASRVTARAATDADASDAGVEVLERQLSSGEALGDDEIAHAVVVDMEGGMDAERARKICNGFPR